MRRFPITAVAICVLSGCAGAAPTSSPRSTHDPSPTPRTTPTSSVPSMQTPAKTTAPSSAERTTEPAAPSITRVGREVLRHAEDPSGTGDLIAVNPETGETRILVQDLRNIASASWSADGFWIAYKDTGGVLSVVGPDGVPRRLTRVLTTTSDGPVMGRWGWEWWPDGARLTYRDADGQFVLDLSTGLTTERDSGPVVAPDGTKALGGVSGGAIHLVDERTQEVSAFVQLPGDNLESCCDITWSPDGSRVAIGIDLDPGENRLFVMGGDGSGIRVVADDTALSGFDWSPDGSRLAFAESSPGELRIWVADAEGTTPTLIGSQPQPNRDEGGDPVWSPDGSQIGFWTEPRTAFVVRADGAGGVSSLDALAYENWRGGWYECSTCLMGTSF